VLDKISVQVMGGWSGNLGRCRTVKLVNVSVDYVGRVRQLVGPDCEIYIRYEYDDPPIDALNAEGAAIQWFGRRLPDMRAMRAAGGKNTIIELPRNEPPTSILVPLVRFYVTLVPLMHREGFAIAVGNCSVGTWNENEWYRFAPIIAQLTPEDRVSLHEYWSDYDDISNPWHCARWTQPQIAAVIGRTPIIVSECGRDIVEGKGLRGWRKTCDGAQFLRDLTKYNALLEQYPQVRGAQVFIVGQHWWPDFDPSPIWPQVVAAYSNPQTYPGALVPVQPPPPPIPQPPPPPPVTTPATVMRGFTPAEFAEYVAGIVVKEPFDKVCIHHTIKPTLAQWQEKGGDYWLKAMLAVYKGRGWTRFPHVFAGPDRIWVMGALELDGAGVANGNKGLRHVEVVGDYTAALPAGATLDNAVAATAILVRKAGKGIEATWMHRDLQMDQTCPGEAFAAKWGWFRALVAAQLEPPPPPQHPLLAPVIKARWEAEEAARAMEGLEYERAHALLLDQIQILYRVEAALKG